jgi:hypothetical protein
MEFRVIWEIDIEAEGPKEAAQQARAIQLIPGMSATVFEVWAYAAGKMHRIDVVEEPAKLDRDELFTFSLGDHPKAAIDDQVKSGHREKA